MVVMLQLEVLMLCSALLPRCLSRMRSSQHEGTNSLGFRISQTIAHLLVIAQALRT